jgi:hypothetical protein
VIDGEFLRGRPSETYTYHLNVDQFLFAFARDEGFPVTKGWHLFNHEFIYRLADLTDLLICICRGGYVLVSVYVTL